MNNSGTRNVYEKDLTSLKEFSAEKPLKKDILKSDKFNVVLVFLEKNQEIKPHPEPYAVFFLVLDGAGLFTTEDRSLEIGKGGCIFIQANKIRGIKANERLTILGVQDGH